MTLMRPKLVPFRTYGKVLYWLKLMKSSQFKGKWFMVHYTSQYHGPQVSIESTCPTWLLKGSLFRSRVTYTRRCFLSRRLFPVAKADLLYKAVVHNNYRSRTIHNSRKAVPLMKPESFSTKPSEPPNLSLASTNSVSTRRELSKCLAGSD